ncbi:MAG: glycosyltransferase family 9 protein [Candidatus Hydrogenedentes bacterium]|nr:glycosyltransferase family 9 protein [Candidatus Hydrogenedentota bacterium]
MINGVPRILLLRLSAIGDVVRVLPALHALRDQYPTAQIDFAVEQKAAAVLLDHPALDKLWVFERGQGTWQDSKLFREFAKSIRRERYDIVVDFHGIFKTGFLVARSGAPQRVGFARPRAQELSWLLLTKRVALPSKRMNRIEENLELAKALGARRHHLEVEIAIPEEARELVSDYLHHQFLGAKKIVAVHVPVDRPEKQWPVQHFVELADLLLGDGRFEVLLTYGPGQRGPVEEVQRLSKRKPEICVEFPDLKHYCALMEQVHLFFGGDTGPMHLASAMNVPVVAVFGGTDPQMHGPFRPPHIVLYAGGPGKHKPIDRRHGPALLAQITAEQAYDACVRLVYGEKRAHDWAIGQDDEAPPV